MFNIESRHLPNLSVQNVLKRISENSNLKNFPGGACARNSLEKCAVRGPDGRYRAHIATVYYISRPLLPQNPPPTPGLCASVESIVPKKSSPANLKETGAAKKWAEKKIGSCKTKSRIIKFNCILRNNKKYPSHTFWTVPLRKVILTLEKIFPHDSKYGS